MGENVIHYGNNSGYQAINFAYLEPVKSDCIILLGFDMQKTGGKVHFFGDHPKTLHNGPDFDHIRPRFDKLASDLKAKGVRVINATRETALTCFETQPLEWVLNELS